MKGTRAQRAAAFEAAKAVVLRLIGDLHVSWEDLGLSDDEIHQISDAAVDAALNTEG